MASAQQAIFFYFFPRFVLIERENGEDGIDPRRGARGGAEEKLI